MMKRSVHVLGIQTVFHQSVLAFSVTVLHKNVETIHHRVRRTLRGLPILARFIAFVVICAAGYGWLSIVLVRLTVDVLSQCSPSLALACVSVGFLFVGWLAQRRRLI